MAKFDLTKLPTVENKKLLAKQSAAAQEIKKDRKVKLEKSEKVGRPRITEELRNLPTTLHFTATEKKVIEEKAGLIPIAAFLRKALQDIGII